MFPRLRILPQISPDDAICIGTFIATVDVYDTSRVFIKKPIQDKPGFRRSERRSRATVAIVLI